MEIVNALTNFFNRLENETGTAILIEFWLTDLQSFSGREGLACASHFSALEKIDMEK